MRSKAIASDRERIAAARLAAERLHHAMQFRSAVHNLDWQHFRDSAGAIHSERQ